MELLETTCSECLDTWLEHISFTEGEEREYLEAELETEHERDHGGYDEL